MSGPRVIPCCMSNAALGHCACSPKPRTSASEASQSERLRKTRERIRDVVSHLGHQGQDADHAWVVQELRAALATLAAIEEAQHE